mgnify:CR=1 FL=1
MSKKTLRKINVSGEKWKWYVKPNGVTVLFAPSGKRHEKTVTDRFDLSLEETPREGVTPGLIRVWIKEINSQQEI